MAVMPKMANARCIASKRIVQASDGIKFVAFVSIATGGRPEYTAVHEEANHERRPRPRLRRRGDGGGDRIEVDAADRPRPVGGPPAVHAARARLSRHQPADAVGAPRHARAPGRRDPPQLPGVSAPRRLRADRQGASAAPDHPRDAPLRACLDDSGAGEPAPESNRATVGTPPRLRASKPATRLSKWKPLSKLKLDRTVGCMHTEFSMTRPGLIRSSI